MSLLFAGAAFGNTYYYDFAEQSESEFTAYNITPSATEDVVFAVKDGGSANESNFARYRFVSENKTIKSLSDSSAYLPDNFSNWDLLFGVNIDVSSTSDAQALNFTNNLRFIGTTGGSAYNITNSSFSNENISSAPIASVNFNKLILSSSSYLNLDTNVVLTGNYLSVESSSMVTVSRGITRYEVLSSNFNNYSLNVDAGATFHYAASSTFALSVASVSGDFVNTTSNALEIVSSGSSGLPFSVEDGGNLFSAGRIKVSSGKLVATGKVIYNASSNILLSAGTLVLNSEDAINGYKASTEAKYTAATDKSSFFVDKTGGEGNYKYYELDGTARLVLTGGASRIEVNATNKLDSLSFSTCKALTVALGVDENNQNKDVVVTLGNFYNGYNSPSVTLTIENFAEDRIFFTEDGFEANMALITEIIATTADKKNTYKLSDGTLDFSNLTTFNGENGYFLIAVPEPAEWAAIFGAIALGLAIYRRRK